jgi:hypothetical protein
MRQMISGDVGFSAGPPSQDWIDDSLRWRGTILTGEYAHWCPDWDYLPIDETSSEWPCPCCMSDGVNGKT